MRALRTALLLSPILALPARAQVATALLREGDAPAGAPAGHLVTSIGNTAANRTAGFAATIVTSDGVASLSHVFGGAGGGPGAVLRTEATGLAGFDQTSFETFFGISDALAIAYGPSCNVSGGGATGLDAVWVDATPIAVEGDPILTLPGRIFRFNSRPGITGTGVAYWVGGINDQATNANLGNGLFVGPGQTCLLKTGDPAPAPLASTIGPNAVDFDVRLSAAGTHWIANTTTTDPTTMDTHLLIDGAIAIATGGGLMSEGTAVPAAAGGVGGEAWQNWGFLGINENGDWMVSGDTNAAGTADGFIVKNGTMVRREGGVVAGLTLVGSPSNGCYMSENGAIACIWDTTGSIEALFLDDALLLKEGDQVDWDGDGALDANTALVDFTGITSLTSGAPGTTGPTTSVLFVADVNVGGVVRQGFFRIQTSSSGDPFCFGDGVDPLVTNTCPCANFGAAGRGCASSFNAAGARMSASGTPALDDVSLDVDGVNAAGNVIFMRGDANNVVGTVFGDGVRCVDGVLRRRTKPIFPAGLASFPAQGDTVTLSNGWGAGNDTPPGSGITAHYMAYYRNAAAIFCPPETFNGTNAWRITW